MPVTSTRRYSSYLTTPSTTSSSGIGSYRSINYNSSSSSSTLPASSSRYNYGSSSSTSGDTSSYRTPTSTYRSSLTSGSTSTYRSSRYDLDDSSSLSTRIGVSKNNSSRYTSDTLPSSSNSSYVSKRALSRMRDDPPVSSNNDTNGKMSLMDDLEFYEKYSPSRYLTKFEAARSRSQLDATSRESSPTTSLNVISSTHTPKSEVISHDEKQKKLFLSVAARF